MVYGSGRTFSLLLTLILNIRHLAVSLRTHTDVFSHSHTAHPDDSNMRRSLTDAPEFEALQDSGKPEVNI